MNEIKEITGTKRVNTYQEWRSNFVTEYKDNCIEMYKRLLTILNERFAEVSFDIDIKAMVEYMTKYYDACYIDSEMADLIDLFITFDDWGPECIKRMEEYLHYKRLPKYYQSRTFLTFKKK